MAILQGKIVETGQTVDIQVPTARMPELPAFEDISDDDQIAAWDQSDNKTKHMTVSQLRSKISGDSVPETPVLSGADMEIRIPAALVGQKRIDVPALAGYAYSLTRRGIGRLATDEFNILSTGGFELAKADDQFYEGDLFFAHIYELEGGSTEVPGSGGNSAPSLITGIKTVNINTTLVTGDMGKLINIAGNNLKIVLTLPELSAIPENTVIPIETMVNNQFQTTITTQGGQFIYFRGTGLSKVYMGRGEVLWVMNGADGWYVINAYGNYLDVGQPIMGYTTVLNTLPAEGQLVNRDAYPRLWEFAQSAGAALIQDSLWQSDAVTYRGCFGTGDGAVTFRIPDLRGTFPRFQDRGRALEKNPRTYNNPGGYQADLVGPHNHPFDIPTQQGQSDNANDRTVMVPGTTHGNTGNTGTGIGLETTVKNTAFIALIKV
ncbi:tail fiber protein [Chitinophaga agrisoli]|uniref:Tail fiber protein n=1 Tax=Chitinophaga agrisoli TaxID=2607653 RepID=A0A5B2VRM8_9BACT|nr:phage tail protein [Chitinophaga agrisoli]KAA2241665.1 tail fiber protein [Chitinophaga agrisoli]